MADFLKGLTKGISSESNFVQNPKEGFQQMSGTQSPAATEQPPNWNSDYLTKQVQGGLNQSTSNADFKVTVPGANPYGIIRQPWIFATFKDLTDKGTSVTGNTTAIEDKALIWYANPKSVDWNISQRATESKTKAGSVLHVWRDRTRGTLYDDPKITFTFQTGNIMPHYPDAMDPSKAFNAQRPSAKTPPGLNDFYKFLELVDSMKLYKGQANLVHILYRSRIFPAMVITGFFDPQAVVRFNDSADNPNQVNSWQATFTIYSTTPKLNSWEKLKQAFEAENKG